MKALLERAMDLMDRRDAAQFDVIGFSIGGWFAQCLAAREPKRVRKLVLAHSFTLEPHHTWRFGLAAWLWPMMPPALLRAGIMKRARLALAPLKRRDPARYRAALDEAGAAIALAASRARLLALQHAIRDSLLHPSGAVPTHPMLILESDDDRIIGAKARAQLARKYPAARRVVLAGAGHASAVTAPNDLAATVDAFLRS